ncbi:2-octaprenyl-6-methoxyphenyl hydroxylase [Shewanella sp. FJAT-52076]|nr:2-octaprenyl-6-methoxyphenyl hydroxylase [Shewanella sp. FJAT-52076]QYJ74503.1 2-octaprenyl-6-methoxyphenyl hydroxylase [Shewanella sp. FJAT-52076]
MDDTRHTNPTAVDDAPDVASQANQAVDIAIVGGAMAGATLALALEQLCKSSGTSLSIALIEARAPGDEHPGFDARAIAVAEGSIEELKRLGVWRHLSRLGTPITDIHVSDRGHFGMTELNSSAFGLPYLGQVVELEAVGKALFDAIAKTRIQLLCPDGLVGMEAGQDAHTLLLESGKRLSAKLVVAADGLGSAVRSHFNLPLEQVDFDQEAVIANVVTRQPHEHWAWERFTDTGPLALLPMAPINGESRLSLVWALAPEQAKVLQECDEQRFVSQLQQAFGNRAGVFVGAGNRQRYPLKLSWMPRPIHHRCVFVGNAAQTLHPIAGQGFNLGLRDIVDLTRVLHSALSENSLADVGDIRLLHRYLALREHDRCETLLAIESLVRGFSNQYWPLVAGRSLGLRLLSWCPPLKAPLASRAMGWRRGVRLTPNL